MKLLPLAQFRRPPRTNHESYTIQWLKNDLELTECANSTSIKVTDWGMYKVNVQFNTPEVRRDDTGLLKSSRTFFIGGEDDECLRRSFNE